MTGAIDFVGTSISDYNTVGAPYGGMRIIRAGWQVPNRPSANYGSGLEWRHPLPQEYRSQFAMDTSGSTPRAFIRNMTNGVWGSWFELSNSSHTHAYLPLTGGTLTGDLVIGDVRFRQSDSVFYPQTNDGARLGGNSNRFEQIHGTTIYENGTALSSKYLPQSGGILDAAHGKAFSTIDAVRLSTDAWNHQGNYALKLEEYNNALAFYVGSVINERKAAIQSGHSSSDWADAVGELLLNPHGGNVGIGGAFASYKLQVHGSAEADTLYEGGTSLASKYAAASHTHNYLLDSTDTFTGTLTVNGSITLDGMSIDEAAWRSGIVEVNRDGTQAWTGWGISFSSTSEWALMGNQTQVGLYDDYNSDWILLYAENAGLSLYYNNAVRLATTSAGVSVTGALTASSNITAYSDERLKENIETVYGALDMVDCMRGVYFNRRDDETKARRVGVIAQEIQSVLPEVVFESEDDTLSVDYGNIVGVLIEAIKELRHEVNQLKESAL
jgi:hypothetical protein